MAASSAFADLAQAAEEQAFTPEQQRALSPEVIIPGGLKAGLYGTLGAGAETLGFGGAADSLSKAAEEASAPELQDYRNIKGAGDLMRYVAAQGAQAVGSMAPTLIPGLGTAGLAGRAALGLRAGARTIQAARTVGGAAGGYGAAFPIEMGETLREAKQLGMDTSSEAVRQVASDKAVVNAALEAAVPAMLGGKFLRGKGAIRTGLATMGAEGATEGAQEISGLFAESRLSGKPVDLADPNTRARLVNAVVGGAVGGGAIGVPIGALEKIGSSIDSIKLPEFKSKDRTPATELFRDVSGRAVESTTELYKNAKDYLGQAFGDAKPSIPTTDEAQSAFDEVLGQARAAATQGGDALEALRTQLTEKYAGAAQDVRESVAQALSAGRVGDLYDTIKTQVTSAVAKGGESLSALKEAYSANVAPEVRQVFDQLLENTQRMVSRSPLTGPTNPVALTQALLEKTGGGERLNGAVQHAQQTLQAYANSSPTERAVAHQRAVRAVAFARKHLAQFTDQAPAEVASDAAAIEKSLVDGLDHSANNFNNPTLMARAKAATGELVTSTLEAAKGLTDRQQRAVLLDSAVAKLAKGRNTLRGWASGAAQLITDKANVAEQPQQQLDVFGENPDRVAAFLSGSAWVPHSVKGAKDIAAFLRNPANRASAARYVFNALPVEYRNRLQNPNFDDIATQAAVGGLFAEHAARTRMARVGDLAESVQDALRDSGQPKLFSRELTQMDLNLAAEIEQAIRNTLATNMTLAMQGPRGETQRAARVVAGVAERGAKAAAQPAAKARQGAEQAQAREAGPVQPPREVQALSDESIRDLAKAYAFGLREIFTAVQGEGTVPSVFTAATDGTIAMYEELADVLDSHEQAMAVLETAKDAYGSSMDLDTIDTIRDSDRQLVARYAMAPLNEREVSKVLQGIEMLIAGVPMRDAESLRLLNVAFGGDQGRLIALMDRIGTNRDAAYGTRAAEAFAEPAAPIEDEETLAAQGAEELESPTGYLAEGYQEQEAAPRISFGYSSTLVPASDRKSIDNILAGMRQRLPRDVAVEAQPLSALTEEDTKGEDPVDYIARFLADSTDRAAVRQQAELNEVMDDPQALEEWLNNHVFFRYGEGVAGEEMSARDYAAVKSRAYDDGSAEAGTLTLRGPDGKRQIFSTVELVRRAMFGRTQIGGTDSLPVNVARALSAGVGMLAERAGSTGMLAMKGPKDVQGGVVPTPFNAPKPTDAGEERTRNDAQLLLSGMKVGGNETPMVQRVLDWAATKVAPTISVQEKQRRPNVRVPDASISFHFNGQDYTLDVSSSAMQIRQGDAVVAGPVLRPDLVVYTQRGGKPLTVADIQPEAEPAKIGDMLSFKARRKAEDMLGTAIDKGLAFAQKSNNKALIAQMNELKNRAEPLSVLDEMSDMPYDELEGHPLYPAYEAVMDEVGPSIRNAAWREYQSQESFTYGPQQTAPITEPVEEIIEEPGKPARRVVRAKPVESEVRTRKVSAPKLGSPFEQGISEEERAKRMAAHTTALLGGEQLMRPATPQREPELESLGYARQTAKKREAQPRFTDEFGVAPGAAMPGARTLPTGERVGTPAAAEFGAEQVPAGVRGTREPMTAKRSMTRFRRLIDMADADNKALVGRLTKAFAHPELTQVMKQELIRTVNQSAATPANVTAKLNELSKRITQGRAGGAPAKPGKPEPTAFRAEMSSAGPRVPRGTMDEVIKEIKRLLGDSVKTEWVENLGHAGETVVDSHLEETIRLAVTAANPMGTAHHEAMHVFLERLRAVPGGARIVDSIIEATSTPAVRQRLEQALAGEPGALRQLEEPLERATYAYQLMRADPSFRLSPATKSWFQKLVLFLRRITSQLTSAQLADRVVDAFSAGTFSEPLVMQEWLANRLEGTLPDAAVNYMNKSPVFTLLNAITSSGDAFMRETGIPAYTRIAELAQAGFGSSNGFLPERQRRMAQWGNLLNEVFKGHTEAEISTAHENLQLGKPPSSPLERNVRKVLDSFYTYMTQSGVERPKPGTNGKEWEPIPFRKNYYPGVWNPQLIEGNRAQFEALLAKHNIGKTAEERNAIIDSIVSGAVSEDLIQGDFERGFTPYMQATGQRQLNELYNDPESLAFRNKSMMETLQRYLYQGVHRAEYVQRFGQRGEVLRDLLEQGKKEGASIDQQRWAQKYAHAVEGTLGATISPKLREAQGWVLLYQNMRLLPLSIFSSFVDPLNITLRTGSFRTAAKAFVRGIKLAFKGMEESETANMMKLIGVIDEKSALETMGNLSGSVYMTKHQRAISDKFFRVIGMTGWNNGMRLAAGEAAMDFLITHTQNPKRHSARWLAELGLKSGDVQIDERGMLKLLPEAGFSREQAERVRQAVNKWVNSVVMRPTAADRPIYGSDPRFALIFHLKQFAYSFHRNINRYVFRELQHGNYWPLMAAASYVPTMMAADFMRGMVQGLGEEPEYKKRWTMGDRTWNAVERAGFTSVPQFALDSAEDARRGQTGLESVLGPTLGQTSQAVQTIAGTKEAGAFLTQALPGQVLFKHW